MIDPKNNSALLCPACMFVRIEARAGSPWFSSAGMVRIENFEL
ncbi:hypothetical protein PAMC26577_14545 [Caballeronia sordidicola]|uniref:Uncharacterized protein n=1 Tax=Caballeronia sordidicola TaxID=196367 RepID=A0A242MTV1_CABSO|nr:hypothetical protein PAMC26577_14545 [Caballeronia sordidicola]